MVSWCAFEMNKFCGFLIALLDLGHIWWTIRLSLEFLSAPVQLYIKIVF